MSESTSRGDGVIVDRSSVGAPVTGMGTAGTGTLPRPARPARAGQRRPARPGATVAPPRPRPRQAAPGHTAPAHTQVAASAIPARLRRVSPSAANRMPFFVLLCGLLGGALISALVINTTLAQGSFEISNLQQSDSALARQQQALQEEVSQAQSAQAIEQRAYQLGMRPVGKLQFVNLKTGKIATNAGSGAVAGISVPGYTP